MEAAGVCVYAVHLLPIVANLSQGNPDYAFEIPIALLTQTPTNPSTLAYPIVGLLSCEIAICLLSAKEQQRRCGLPLLDTDEDT